MDLIFKYAVQPADDPQNHQGKQNRDDVRGEKARGGGEPGAHYQGQKRPAPLHKASSGQAEQQRLERVLPHPFIAHGLEQKQSQQGKQVAAAVDQILNGRSLGG